jgi:hypothetical protein
MNSLKNILFIGIIILTLGISGPDSVLANTPTIKIGTYGVLAPFGINHETTTATVFNNLGLDWFWAQYNEGMASPHPAIDSLKSAGKRVILRTYFWDAVPGKDWTTLRNNPSDYDVAYSAIKSQIDQFGEKNLYGLTINEEEPSLGYDLWDSKTFTDTQGQDYAFGVNLLYNKIKTDYPRLKVIGTNHVLSKLTDAQFKAVTMDGLLCYEYFDTAELQGYLQRGMNLATEMGIAGSDIFTLIYAGMDANYGTVNNPLTTISSFEMAVKIGYSNIGFFSDNAMISHVSNGENLLFNNYPFSSAQYTHKETMLKLIAKYVSASPNPISTTTPTPASTPTQTSTPTSTPAGTLTPVSNSGHLASILIAVGGLMVIGLILFVLSQRKRTTP